MPIAGVWKSNEEKILENIKKANLSEKQKKFLSNGFFGKLITEVSCQEFTSIYEDERTTIPYESVEINGNKISVSYFEELLGKVIVISRTLTLDGNCISLPLEELGFSEVFCRIEKTD